MRTWKDVIRVGTYRLPDGRRIEFTPNDLRHLQTRVKAMAAANVLPSLSWEHQDEAKPQTEAERRANKARFCLGHVYDARLADDDELELLLDVPDPDDFKRLASVRFTSPELVDNFVDGNGRVWSGKSITHVAVCPLPVQHGQRPFKAAQLSVVRLSLSDRIEEETMLDAKFMTRLKNALAKHGLLVEWGRGTDPTDMLEGILRAAETSDGRTRTVAQDNASPVDMSLAEQGDPRGCWAPPPRLTPTQVDAQVSSFMEMVGRDEKGR